MAQGKQKKICNDGRIWGQNNRTPKLGVLTDKPIYIKKGYNPISAHTSGQFKKGHKPWNTGKTHLKGSKNSHWKGGITTLNEMIRHCDKYVQWRNDIFIRDNYTCQHCQKHGGRLEAHHKIEFSSIMTDFLKFYDQFSPLEDKETLLKLSFKHEPFWDLNNGETICFTCHNLTKKGTLCHRKRLYQVLRP